MSVGKYTFSNRLLAWWALAVMVVVSAHVSLDYIGVERAFKGVVEAVLTATLIVVPYLIMRKRVAGPLTEISETARRITAGDLQARAHVESPVEVKALSDALNAMVDKLTAAYEKLLETNRYLEKSVAERTLALSVEHEKLSAIVKNIPDGVVMVSVACEIVELNPMMEEIWGVMADEVKGKSVYDLPEGPVREALTFDCKARPPLRCWEFHKCAEKNCPAYMSDDIRCWLVSGTFCRKGVQASVKRKLEDVCSECGHYKDVMERCGEVREAEINGRFYKIGGALVLDDNKKVVGEIKTFYDFTAEKVLEKKKSDFVSLITHDLKSPLSNIIGYSDLMLNGGRDLFPEETEYVIAIRRNALRLLDMVVQYLDLTRMEAGLLSLKLSQVRPEAFISEAVAELQVQAKEKGIKLSLDIEPGMTVEADAERMGRVVTNLVGNAIKYTPGGGSITVSACSAEDAGTACLEITVSDTGYGIMEADLPHVFDRYYRATSGIAAGTGLGLAVVKSLVEAHGGRVNVESVEGSGSRFRVIIPLKQETGNENAH